LIGFESAPVPAYIRGVAPPATTQTEAQAAAPQGFGPRELARRSLPIFIGITLLVLVALLAPGLGQVRDELSGASAGLVAIAVLLELASCISYVLMFRPVFATGLPWKTSTEIGLSEVAMGSVVPASGAGGLALGAWILSKQGMKSDRIACRSVAFFLIKSSVNFVAVAAIGLAMASGLVHTDASLALTLVPAVMAIAVIAGLLALPRIGRGRPPGPTARRMVRATAKARRALVTGIAEAVFVVRSGNVALIVGAIGYWAFDNAVLWATFQAIGESPPLAIILMGYLIGQLGGLLPIPGGIGGIDGGLIGTLVVYGTPAAATAAAVLVYRLILFWVPLVIGTPAFVALWRRELRDPPAAEALAAGG